MHLKKIKKAGNIPPRILTFAALRQCLIIIFASAALMSASAAANAIELIRWPTLNSPALLLMGETIKAEVDFGGVSAQVVSAKLKPSFEGNAAPDEIPLNSATAQGFASVDIPLPKNMAPGLYDLCISYVADGVRRVDCNDHAVDVITSYKKSFRFAVLSDIHVGDPFVPNMDQGIPGRALRLKAYEALRKEAPDFVLISGDLISYPWSFRQDYPNVTGNCGITSMRRFSWFPAITIFSTRKKD